MISIFLSTLFTVLLPLETSIPILIIRILSFHLSLETIEVENEYKNRIAYLEQPNLREMSISFGSEILSCEHSADVNTIMRKIGLTDKEKYTLKLIMSGMNPYRVSKHLKMSNHGVYNRANRARCKHIKTYGVPANCGA